jgi:hypothetical protein
MRVAFAVCGLILAAAAPARAHRLDEYLQAARIAVATNQIDLAFELTPGVAVAEKVIAHIDHNQDGLFSGEESSAYTKQFLQDLTVSLDGRVLGPALVSFSFPASSELRTGTGVLRIRARCALAPLAAGEHTLTLTNRHLPAISVHLVNALRSKVPSVEIGQQTRDELQRHYQLRFRVTPAPVAPHVRSRNLR